MRIKILAQLKIAKLLNEGVLPRPGVRGRRKIQKLIRVSPPPLYTFPCIKHPRVGIPDIMAPQELFPRITRRMKFYSLFSCF